MSQVEQMIDLIEKLNYYTKLYDEGQPSISDKTWDDMYFQLQELEKETGIVLANSPTAHIDYQVVDKLEKVEHNHLMLSLAKTKNEDDIVNFLTGHDGVIMAKMDGLTCSLRYVDGKLVSAETRGNGIIGENITHNIKFVKNVPLEIQNKDELVVDGEVICSYKDFEDFASEYKNPRNFASGSIRLLDSKICAQRKLSFIAWDCIKELGDCATLTEKLFALNSYGFESVPYIPLPKDIINEEKIHHSIILIQNWAKDEGYPIDGAVFKYDDCAYYQSLGYTEHHFRGGLAFKFYDEEYETTLQNIEWSMGKTGQLTPVAIFDPVDDGESVITRASLHNLNIMKQTLGAFPHKGQKIWVCKQNMIIPQIVRAIPDYYSEPGISDEDRLLTYPRICPICGGKTVVRDDFLYCDNPNCEGQLVNKLDHFAGKKGLDIKGLSKSTLQKFIDWGWVGNLVELFSLSNFRDEWLQQPRFGEKSVNNLLDSIENASHCELWQFISGLSIPLVGSVQAKEIAKRTESWEEFKKNIQENYDFTQWDGFGPETDYSLHNFNYYEADELAKNLDIKNSLWIDPNAPVEKIESAVSGKIFCVTGSVHIFKNRDEVKAAIEEKGGKVTDSVTAKTTYLITNNPTSGSSKNVKAKQLGIPIITEEELIAML